MMNLIATTSASDEINPEVWTGAFVCWWFSVALAIGSALLLMMIRPRRPRMELSFAGIAIVLSLVVVLFVLYVYDIDYVAVGRDGTPSSGPLLPKLIKPAFPMLLSVAVLVARVFVRKPRAFVG